MKRLLSYFLIGILLISMTFSANVFADDNQNKQAYPFHFEITEFDDATAEVSLVMDDLSKEIIDYSFSISHKDKKEEVSTKDIEESKKYSKKFKISKDKEYHFSVNLNKKDIQVSYDGTISITNSMTDSQLSTSDAKPTIKLKNVVVNESSTNVVMLAATRYESESNNTYTSANRVYDDDDVYGTMSSTSDVDWYVVSFPSAGSANFWLGQIPSGCDYDFQVYASNGTTLLGSSTSGSNNNELITLSVSANTNYYMKVYSYSGSSSSYYLVRAKNYPTSSSDTWEPNDSIGAAKYISNNTTITNANIGAEGDNDYFYFTISQSSNITLSLSNIPSGCDYDLYLYNSAGSLLNSSTAGSNTSETINATSQPAGTYYVRVLGYSGSSSSYYRLQVTTSVASIIPTISLSSPSANRSEELSVGHSIYISASGTNCSRIEVYANNSLVNTVYSNSLSYYYPVNTTGTYNIYVKGISSSGNTVNSATRTVTVNPSSNIVVSGTLRAAMPQNGSGSTTTTINMANIKVRIMDDNGVLPNGTWGETTTNSSGYFSISIPNDNTIAENGRDIYLEVEFENEAVRVTNSLGSNYIWKSAVHDNYRYTTLNFGTITLTEANDLDALAAYNIYKNINQGYNYFISSTGTTIEQVQVKWWSTRADNSWLSGDTIYISGGLGHHFMQSVQLHEYGHYVMHKAAATPSGGYLDGVPHYYDQPYTSQSAYREGWAHYFASSVLNVGSLQQGASTFNLENSSGYALQSNYSENLETECNAAIVWRDLFDNNIDTMQPSSWSDNYSTSFLTTYNTMKSKVHDNMWEYYDTFISYIGSASKLDVWKIFNSRAISYDQTLPSGSLSVSNMTVTASVTDDVAIAKYRWSVGTLIGSEVNGTPTTYTVPMVLAPGYHDVVLRLWDYEGIATHSGVTGTARTNSGVADYSDIVTTIYIQGAGGTQSGTMALESYNLVSYVDKGTYILENTTDTMSTSDKSSKKVKAMVEETNIDLMIYSGINGSVKAINIYRPTGELYQTLEHIVFDDPVLIKNAEAGEWTVEYIPLEENPYPVGVETIIATRPNNSIKDATIVVNSENDEKLSNFINNEVSKYGSKQKMVMKKRGTDIVKHITKQDSGFEKELLNKGKNVFLVSVTDENSYSTDSQITIIYDPDAPVIDIPNMNSKTNTITANERLFGFSGYVDEDAHITINGEEKSLYFDGSRIHFGHDVELRDGKNIFDIVATDKAGNVTTLQLIVEYLK